MRLAGQNTQEDPEVFQTIWKHLKTDGGDNYNDGETVTINAGNNDAVITLTVG